VKKLKKGLKYLPSTEEEVVLLFGFLIPHLDDDFTIVEFKTVEPTFPDCIAIVNGNKVGVEFELYSGNFFIHDHHRNPNLKDCNLIVCWANTLENSKLTFGDHVITIYELSEIVRRKNLEGFFENFALKPTVQRKEVLEKIESSPKLKAIYDFCNNRPEFTINFGKGEHVGSFNLIVRDWKLKGIGKPQPFQFYSNEIFCVDFRNLKQYESPIREIFNEPKKGYILQKITDENFPKIMKLLNWITTLGV
jgi:hypothetical protein